MKQIESGTCEEQGEKRKLMGEEFALLCQYLPL